MSLARLSEEISNLAVASNEVDNTILNLFSNTGTRLTNVESSIISILSTQTSLAAIEAANHSSIARLIGEN